MAGCRASRTVRDAKVTLVLKCHEAARVGLDPYPSGLNHWRNFRRTPMFEVAIFCVIVLAIGYWVALWLLGRHDDVLHGDFVHPEQGTEPAPSAFPPSAFPPARVDRSDTLESLLASIKRDLKDAAQL